MTWTGRGEPSATEPVTRGQRQGSVSSARAAGTRARPPPWAVAGPRVPAVLMVVIVGGGGAARPGTARCRMPHTTLARSNPQVMRLPFVPDVVRERLGAVADHPGRRPRRRRIKFTVDGGGTWARSAAASVDAGLLLDALAFTYLAVTQGVDDKLHTGTFNLDAEHDAAADRRPAPAAARPADDQGVHPPPGGPAPRADHRQAALDQNAAGASTREEFYELVHRPAAVGARGVPVAQGAARGSQPGRVPGRGHDLASTRTSRPRTCSRVLLDDWETDIGPSVIERGRSKDGKDFYEVLTLASIVERETARGRSERRKVAGVYQNRLDRLWRAAS